MGGDKSAAALLANQDIFINQFVDGFPDGADRHCESRRQFPFSPYGTARLPFACADGLGQQAFDFLVERCVERGSGEVATALLGKHVMIFAETPAVATQYQLRPLAVFADKRIETHTNVPTVIESGIDVRGTVWGGLVAPKGLPVDVRTRLQVACASATATEGYKASANRLNSPLVYRDAATFTTFAASEAKAYAAAVREFGLEEK